MKTIQCAHPLTYFFLINDAAYKTLSGAKPLHVIFDKVDAYIQKT